MGAYCLSMKKVDKTGYERDMTAIWGTVIFVVILALVIWVTHVTSGGGDHCQAAPQQDYSNAQGC